MNGMTNDLLQRIVERASDPGRRYMTAAEDQSRVELPVGDIKRRWNQWHAANRLRAREAAFRDGMTPEEFEANVKRNREIESSVSRELEPTAWSLMEQQMRAWGSPVPETMSFIETDDQIGASTSPPGVRPLPPPAQQNDWETLEGIVGRSIPDELKRLYAIADGGFGPGFTGLLSVRQIADNLQDLRRRGPDYCGTIAYPDSFIPVAEERLNYHFDLETGRVISSNQDWVGDGLKPQDIYEIAFQSLELMMEDWLARS
jgi:hypothetical protein